MATKGPAERGINRTAAVMVASACCFMVAGMVIPFAAHNPKSLTPWLLMAAGILAGGVLAVLGRHMRNRLREPQRQDEDAR
jgi:ABC-type uncharacterized transport system permease subunit